MSHQYGVLKTLKLLRCFFPALHSNWNCTCTLRREKVLRHGSHAWPQDWVGRGAGKAPEPGHSRVPACKCWAPESRHDEHQSAVHTRNLMCWVDQEMDRQLAGALERPLAEKRCLFWWPRSVWCLSSEACCHRFPPCRCGSDGWFPRGGWTCWKGACGKGKCELWSHKDFSFGFTSLLPVGFGWVAPPA